MTKQSFVRRMFAGTMIVMFALSAVVQARPMPPRNVFIQQDEKRKLPPVNWIRSRKIDVKHLDIDLRFDWDKEQAIGSTVVTFAPFSDTDTFQLDAALMTIESVTLVGGGALKYTYDGKADDDNLDVTLDRVYKAGEDVSGELHSLLTRWLVGHIKNDDAAYATTVIAHTHSVAHKKGGWLARTLGRFFK